MHVHYSNLLDKIWKTSAYLGKQNNSEIFISMGNQLGAIELKRIYDFQPKHVGNRVVSLGKSLNNRAIWIFSERVQYLCISQIIICETIFKSKSDLRFVKIFEN